MTDEALAARIRRLVTEWEDLRISYTEDADYITCLSTRNRQYLRAMAFACRKRAKRYRDLLHGKESSYPEIEETPDGW